MIPPNTQAPATVVPPPPNRQALDALGGRLMSRFTQYETERRLAELKWMRNLRQFLGEYDPDIKVKLDPNRSQAYPRLTRVKCVSTVSRLMNLMFPSSEKNWSIEPSPVPNLPIEIMQSLLAQVQQQIMQAQQQGQPVDVAQMVELAVQAEAKVRAEAMSQEIDDQLDELGGTKNQDYVTLCRKVVASGVLYGAGVLTGPFVREQQQRSWQMNPMTGQLEPSVASVMRPQFEFVPIWDYYPDMSAKTWDQMDGQFQRYVMSRHQVRKLADREDFFGSVIKEYLAQHQQGNYKRRTYETELKSLGVHTAVGDNQGRKYELIKWEGFVYAPELSNIGIEVPPEMMAEDVPAVVWVLDGTVIKGDLNPWFRLSEGGFVNTYHQFVFEEDDTALIGNGLPNVMRDSQMGVAATARMAMDNASVVCGPQLELNTDLMRLDQDLKSIGPYKIWYREGTGADASLPAIREIKIDSHLQELISMMNVFKEFADTETFVNPANSGDMSRGPSEPYRTATGASMLKGDAALPFKDVVRNFDAFTQSVMTSLLAFNQYLSTKDSIKGDYQAVARGAMSLVAKEIRGSQLDQYVMSLQPEERAFVNWYEMALERGAARDMPLSKVFVAQIEADQIKAGQAAQQQKESQDQEELMKASVRKILAESLKNLSQAGKNDAAAATTVFSTLLKGLEAGVTPNEVAAAGGAKNYVPVSPGTGVDSSQAVAAAPDGQNPGGADLGQFLG
jgi:hypothetical protein